MAETSVEPEPRPLVIPRAALDIALPYLIIGAVAVVAGGLVAAVARPANWDHGSWASAYLVLVGGVATWVGGSALAFLAGERAGISSTATNVVCGLWVAANATVMVGALTNTVAALLVGSGLLVAILVVSAYWVARGAPGSRWRILYLSAVALVVASVPVGVVLNLLGD